MTACGLIPPDRRCNDLGDHGICTHCGQLHTATIDHGHLCPGPICTERQSLAPIRSDMALCESCAAAVLRSEFPT